MTMPPMTPPTMAPTELPTLLPLPLPASCATGSVMPPSTVFTSLIWSTFKPAVKLPDPLS